MLLFAISFAPGLAISIYIYWKDKFEKEPRHLLVKCFLLGVLSTIPAIFLETMAKNSLPVPDGNVILTAVYSFFGIGLIEEGCKYFFLRNYVLRKEAFNEPFDGITYAVMVSMGFATLENFLYVYDSGISTGIFRMFTAVPAHAAFGVIMGYYFGLRKMQNSAMLGWLGLFFAAALHAAYDFFLLISYIPGMWIGAIFSLFLGIRFSLKAIRLHQEGSPFNTN